MAKYYPKTQEALQTLLKRLAIDDFDIEYEDEYEIQGTICEFDDSGPQYRNIGIVKPGKPLIVPTFIENVPSGCHKTFECMSCYRKIHTWLDVKVEDGGSTCKNDKLEPTTKIFVKYYDCKYCKSTLKYVENEYTK